MSPNHETAFDTATRIAAGATRSTYDRPSIWLHWATALLVAVQFAMAETWDWFARPTRHAMESIHVSLGILLAAVIVARLVWRLLPGHRVEPLHSGPVRLASKAVHYLLYALLVAQAGFGFVLRWAQGEPLSFFGLFAIPGPIEATDRATRRGYREWHENLGWAIVILAGAHAVAALYHHYALKDRVLARMLPRGA
jgi:cytochrome b561